MNDAFDASRLGAVQTTLGLGHRHLLREADVHLFQTSSGTIDGIELWHDDTLNLRALLRLHRSTKFLTPLGITISQHVNCIIGRIAVHHDICGGSRFFTLHS